MIKGIFIPNVGMPKVCPECFAFHYETGDYEADVYCEITGEELEDPKKRGDECPLVEMSEQTERSEEIQGLDYAESILENILREQEGSEE